MKNLLFVLICIVIAGFGCLASRVDQPGGQTPVLEQPIEAAVELFGVLDEFDETGRRLHLTMTDGSRETVLLNDASAISDSKGNAADVTVLVPGPLVYVKGVRNLASREVTAEEVELVEDRNIFVTSPASGSTVTSPLIAEGFARVFESQFNWRIRNAAGDVVDQGTAMAMARDAGFFGPFRLEIFLPALTDTSFTLEVLDYSAKDGSEQDVVKVPLKLLSTATTEFDVYFNNFLLDPEYTCELVFPAKRTVAQTSAVGRAALLELLKGPTQAESEAGYSSNLPDGVGLNSLVISEGTATADFDAGLRPVAGSCRVSAIRSSIEQTLLQFPTVADVVISVEGNVEEALQP